MSHAIPREKPELGRRIKALRQKRGLSLARLADLTPLSEATLSRIENSLTDISANNLYALAAALDTTVEAFFSDGFGSRPAGLRSITRSGEGMPFRAGAFRSQLLASDLPGKKMAPFMNETAASSIGEAGGLNAHPGEEFLLVTEGVLALHTEFYEPLRLEAGDSIYFDATTPHAYVNAGTGSVKFLVVTSEPAPTKDNHP